jgi:hypothetical protein
VNNPLSALTFCGRSRQRSSIASTRGTNAASSGERTLNVPERMEKGYDDDREARAVAGAIMEG